MYRNRKDVDQLVESLLSRLPPKEFFSRGYSIGRMYYEVGDYSSCRRYVEQYVAVHNDNAAAHTLLGQALQKLGLKEKALEEFKTSYGICPSQTSLVLNICEILAGEEGDVDVGRARYWLSIAEKSFPRHAVTSQLRENLMAISNSGPEALALLTEELANRPKDVLLHIRLLKCYLKSNNIEAAFTHSYNVEFSETNFIHNFEWYKTVSEILKCNPRKENDWNFQLLLLTVTERMCSLSLTETHNHGGTSIEATEHLHIYDQSLERVATAGFDQGGASEFHSSLLQHHRSQFAFLAATLLLKRDEDYNWNGASRDVDPLMLIAWQSAPIVSSFNWVNSAPKVQQNAARRWHCEASYMCSQVGHYLLANVNDKSQAFLDRISQNFAGALWQEKLYERIFYSSYHLEKIKTSYLQSSSFKAPELNLPRRNEIEVYDAEAQRAYGNSLHHLVWMLLNYKDYSQFRCTTFDVLPLALQNDSNCSPESLCQLDVFAFLYCAALTSRKNSSSENWSLHKPKILPANITPLLCTLTQMKWWDCAYKFSRNELGTEMSDIRATLSRGIETVRCIDNHGLDPELLCKLGRIFSNRGKQITDIDEKRSWEMRAVLYFSAAIPLIEKVATKIITSDKRLFDYVRQHLLPKESSSLLEESKLYVAMYHLNDGDYEKAIKLLSNLKLPQALYSLSVIYKKMALDFKTSPSTDKHNSDVSSTVVSLLSKAREYGQEALYKLNDPENKSNHLLLMETKDLLREIETNLKENTPIKMGKNGELDNSSSDEYVSFRNDDVPHENRSLLIRNLSSTPKRPANLNSFRTPVESPIIVNQTTESQSGKKNPTMNDFMDLTKSMFDENRQLGNQIISSLSLNTKNTIDEFAHLKISVIKLKDQVDECRNECKDLKHEVADLKKEISKLKKVSSDQAAVENEFLNLDEEYRANDAASTFTSQLPLAAQQVIPPFNQRLIPFSVPPNPFQLYGQNWFNLYNQCSQFAQPAAVPGGTPMFDAIRSQVNYPGVFPTPDQMYLDVANLVQQTMPSAPAVPVIPAQTTVPTPLMPPLSVVSKSHSTVPTTISGGTRNEAKETAHSLPANVVITCSDPVPTCTTSPAPVLSVTIPSKHIKGIPHNYQIQMPETESAPPTFGFPTLNTKTNASLPSSNFNQTSVFKSVFTNANAPGTISFAPKLGNSNTNNDDEKANDSLNKSRTLSEKSNTSVDNYDPCPDFKPIIPLPAEVVVTTGEEDESVIFNARAKLFRFADNQWKERGLGEIKLLKHNVTGKVRVLMRREQIHKICANHHITPEMEMKPMKKETKAYIWVANDFADEKFVLEKLCIRFKTADIAHKFYETFEKERKEMTKSETTATVQLIPKPLADESIKTQNSLISNPTKDMQPAITKFGGFTFTSTPTFKPVEDNKPIAKAIDASPKTNVFSSLNFKTDATSSSLFKNLASLPTTQINNSNTQSQEEIQNNSIEPVEEYEPTKEFKPVVPLPALVDTKTGEEDEIVLFEHRAKLLRFIAASKEWKERGVGNIKLLVHKDNVQKVRLLMRREQVMKVCCNHAITKSMIFQKMPKLDKAVTWCAQDFSEGELTPETFCLRFSTVQACDDFIDAVKSALSKLKDESKAAKEEQNAAKQNYQVGDKSTTDKPTVSSLGDKFKPKPGSWECTACYVRNEENSVNCGACNQPKNPNIAVKETTLSNKFNFGISSQIMNNSKTRDVAKPDKPVSSGWGDQFKPKQGSWECQGCLVRNNPDVEICPACNSSRVPGGAKPESKGLVLNSDVKFKFGIPSQVTEEKAPTPLRGDSLPRESSAKPTTAWSTGATFNFGVTPATGDKAKNTTNMFDGTGVHKFSFGATPKIQEQPNIFSKGNSPLKQEPRPALLPTPSKPSEAPTFDFVFKPKTETKAKSPLKYKQEDDIDGNEYASEDEGHHIQIAPVVPLPDKITVVTGEEDEDEIFGHRAKLFIFVKGEWKERGIGVVKILRHKHTAKLRVVMRREQVHKICLNHALTKDIIYNLKDEKNWIFAAIDFSEGELALLRFCLKFKTKEIALQFKDSIDMVRDGVNTEPVDAKDSDVEFVDETKSNDEEKRRAKELMLPENFYLYKNKKPCPGCRGCEDDRTAKPIVSENNTVPVKFQGFPTTTTPFKISSISSNESVYFTPNINKSSITPNVFHTPESIGSDVNVSHPVNEFGSKSEVKLIQKPKPFSVDKQTSILKPPMFSASTATNNATSTQTGNTSDSQSVDPKSIFAPAHSGLPKNSIFGFQSKDKSAAHPIFGTDLSNKPNSEAKVFPSMAISQGHKFDENAATATMPSKINEPSIFSSGNTTKYFGNGKSIFGLNANSDRKTANEADTSKTDLTKELVLGSGNELSFNSYSTKPVLKLERNPDFKWEGAGQQLFANVQKPKPSGDADHDGEASNADEEYDPHYEPIVPLPDKIVVTTGEEDEEKIFGQRCKLFRFNYESKDWKERGVGELKILYHPKKKTYRLLFRREQIHKAVLNMLLFADFPELLPLKKSVCAWTWSGRNFAESDEGVQELLAVRFKNVQMASDFESAVKTCVRKLQAAAAQAHREEQEKKQAPKSMAHLRLPRHLDDSARADNDMAMGPGYSKAGTAVPASPASPRAPEVANRLLFQGYSRNDEHDKNDQDNYGCEDKKLQAAAAQAHREEQEKKQAPKSMAHLRLPKHLDDSARADNDMAMGPGYSKAGTAIPASPASPCAPEVANRLLFQDYSRHDEHDKNDQDNYGGEDEWELFASDCAAMISTDGGDERCDRARVTLLLDQELGALRLLLADQATGELLSDLLLLDETDLQLSGRTCSWSGTDCRSDEPADTTVAATFADDDLAMKFFDCCESTRANQNDDDEEDDDEDDDDDDN